jgi:hypothetical protein
MKNLNLNQIENLNGGLCLNDGINGLEHHFGDCTSVCNVLNLLNPTYDAPCIL